MRIHSMLLVAAALLAFVACSDDKLENPAGTISLNMLNANNGETPLGVTDITINDANNFVTREYPLADVGRCEGLGAIGMPKLSGLAPQVAVEPGRGYFICKAVGLRTFQSGEKAIALPTACFKAYVRSWITNKEGERIGAAVDYVATKMKTYGLPEYGKSIGMIRGHDELVIKLSTSDFEYELIDKGLNISARKEGNKLIINGTDAAQYELYLRIKESYTLVNFDLTY